MYFCSEAFYFKIYVFFFLTSAITISENKHVPFSLSQIMMAGLLLHMVLSVFTCSIQNMITLLSQLGSTTHSTCPYHCSQSNLTLLPCICYCAVENTLYHASLHTILLPVLGMLIQRVLSYCCHSLYLLLSSSSPSAFILTFLLTLTYSTCITYGPVSSAR